MRRERHVDGLARKLLPPVSLVMVLTVSAPTAAQERMAGFLREEYSCIMCHTDMRSAFLAGVHAERGVECVTCHGGNPNDFTTRGAHSGAFEPRGEKQDAVALCVGCHGDIARMRPFGLQLVTRDEFAQSRHGQLLFAGASDLAPTCGDCHGSHAILPRTDSRSPIHPTKIGATCSRCHDDVERMPPEHGLLHSAEWRESAHGRALLEDGNFRSATCASCHGAHGALPPGLSEIANVCGRCHQLIRAAYLGGSHGDAAANGGAAGCTVCHDHHGTETPSFAEIPALCQRCHDTGSSAETVGLELRQRLEAAYHASERAEEAINELVAAGEATYDEEVRLVTVRTHLKELAVAVHALDPEPVDELARRVSSLATEIGERADIIAEERWERRLLLIPLWLGILAACLLALRKRRQLSSVQGEAMPAGGGSPATGEDS